MENQKKEQSVRETVSDEAYSMLAEFGNPHERQTEGIPFDVDERKDRAEYLATIKHGVNEEGSRV